ncbi:hypothetical protein [Tateyamaria sp. ANG-S1]|uniref:hypothetical protein n=1 Tax=Tateyamaria sp. ANG-S1 TaxID=1577905 RepID=UPI0009E260CC|nr:hypothetical protein [Tateyamaria sp. ANG-S1]
MFSKWLDEWDEKHACEADQDKTLMSFDIGAALCFPDVQDESFSGFCQLAKSARADPGFYDLPATYKPEVQRNGSWITFQSAIRTEVPENNVVTVKVTPSRSGKRALVVFHHWRAEDRNAKLASLFSRLGFDVFEIAMPYHL